MSYSDPSRATGDGQEIQENPGFIASDSLAAESLRNSDDGFASNQTGIAASDVKGMSSTANTTDTSGATTLPAAEYRSDRLPDSTDDYQTSTGESDRTYDTTRGGPQESYAGDVPSYALSDAQAKPKGSNLQEGGFDSDAPNASFNTDIGGSKDPGRLAEAEFERSNARSGADAGYPNANDPNAVTGTGGFDELQRDESA